MKIVIKTLTSLLLLATLATPVGDLAAGTLKIATWNIEYLRDDFGEVRKAAKKRAEFVRFRFNDIRHKAATDVERDYGREFARRLLGHADQRTTAIYVSEVQRVKPLK